MLSCPILVRKNHRGFTLIELLAVIAIIGVLAGILIPVVLRVRSSAERATCVSNLRQTSAACMLYTAENRDYLPDPDLRGTTPPPPADCKFWWDQIRPYYATDKIKSHQLQALRCPSHAKRLKDVIGKDFGNNYGMNCSLGRNYSPARTIRRTLASLPSPSRTLMITECAYNATDPLTSLRVGNIVASATFPVGGTYIGGAHGGANNILWCDGHVSAFKDVKRLSSNPPPGEPDAQTTYWTPGFSATE
ncbi:MAG: prepilin-type N-terminal cleavage/methylation domain-containing protein [Opitutaceae bacterium]|jgi:prepilin-type N-terminal cleavage/methylation domain-containing protein/prepilin-type processing-associated H-X9-DG protein|nr:prepilin-type N-terminal cleavage/methylation domain-containing protein [Opitutaceae bacterium]